MMDAMMNSMIKSMPAEVRERMLLQMMPEMMKQADLKKMVPNVLETTGKMVSLYDVFIFLKKAIEDDELTTGLSEKANGMADSMSEMMSMMMPLMMSFMHKMMPMMMKMMPKMMESCMSGTSACSTEMVSCMQQMFPHCAEFMCSNTEPYKENTQALEMLGTIAEVSAREMNENEKQDFQQKAFDIVINGIYKKQ